jgi:hypothetical protein
MRLAATTVFCNRTGVDVGKDPINVPDTDVSAATLAGGTERVLKNDVEVTEAIVKDALAGGLFDRRGDRRRVFAHRTYAEFLAARYLAERRVPPAQIRELIFSADGRVFPQLHETTAWLVEFIPPLLPEIAAADPRVILLSDVALKDEANRERVTASLLAQFDRGGATDFDGSLSGQLAVLAHAKLPQQLRPFIIDKARNESARRLAIDIARACKVAELNGTLSATALDAAEPHHLRARAARAYAAISPRDDLDALAPLLTLPPAEDPEDELKAIALFARWPHRMTARTLFDALETPRQHVLGSSYWRFLHTDFVEALGTGDVPVALEWIRKHPTLRDPGHQLLHPVSAVMQRAWRDAADPAVMAGFAETAFILLDRHESLAKPAKGGKYERLIAPDDPHRRTLVENLVRMSVAKGACPARMVIGQTPVVFDIDIPWLLDRLLRSDDSSSRA